MAPGPASFIPLAAVDPTPEGDAPSMRILITDDHPLWLVGVRHALDLAAPSLAGRTVGMGMPDTIVSPPDCFARLLDLHEATRADLSLGVFPVTEPQAFAPVVIEPGSHRVLAIADEQEVTRRPRHGRGPLDPPHRARQGVLAQPTTGPRPMAGVPADRLITGVTHDATHLSPMSRLKTLVGARGVEPPSPTLGPFKKAQMHSRWWQSLARSSRLMPSMGAPTHLTAER